MMKIAAFLIVGFSSAVTAQGQKPTAADVVARIQSRAGVSAQPRTVDTFKAGDSTTRVTGIAVTMMATLDVLQRAAAAGRNLIITHEPTFYSHRDTTGTLESENDAVLAAKKKFIADNKLVVWRFHDTPHAMKPDLINAGIVRALGWQNMRHNGSDLVFTLAPTSIAGLAALVSQKLGANATRIAGDRNARVTRVVLTQGFQGFPLNRAAMKGANADVLIIGEDHEWETIEYAIDAISAGQLKGLIVLGHIASEQAGMDEVARWLRTFIRDIPVDLVPTKEPFTPAQQRIR